MNALPTRRQEHRDDRRPAPMPQRGVARVATTAPMNDDEPADPGDRRRSPPGSERQAPRATNRNHVAPKTPHSAASAIWATDERPQDRIVPDEPKPVADLGQRPARGPRAAAVAPPPAGSCRAGPPRPGNVTASIAIAIGAVRTWTRKPLIPKAHELGGGSARRECAVGLDEPVALDDRRQVGVVGRRRRTSSGRRPAPATTSSCANVRTPSANATGIEPSNTARPRSAQIRTGRRRSRSTQAPATSPKRASRRARRCAGSPPRPRPAPRTRIAASGSAIRVMSDPKIEIVAARPDPDEGRVAPERGGERVAHGDRSIAGASRQVADRDLRLGGLTRDPAVHSAAPRCVRTRAPPGPAPRPSRCDPATTT